MNLTKDIYSNTESFIAEMPKKERKECGQLFTNYKKVKLEIWRTFTDTTMENVLNIK